MSSLESMLEDVLRRLARIEIQMAEVVKIQRRTLDRENAPPAPARTRQRSDGTWEMWLGEGTGWGPCTPPKGGKS